VNVDPTRFSVKRMETVSFAARSSTSEPFKDMLPLAQP
jgi:hypothetical protein